MAIIDILPAQLGQARTSRAYARFMSVAQSKRRSRVGSSGPSLRPPESGATGDTTKVCFGESANDEMCFIWAYYHPSAGRFIAATTAGQINQTNV
jgi:hypothetical protein